MSYGRLLARLADAQRFPAIHRLIAAGVFEQPGDANADFDFGLERIELAVTHNHHEAVVEIVGDAPGELANRAKFLRFAELLIEPLLRLCEGLLRLDVGEETGDVLEAALGVSGRECSEPIKSFPLVDDDPLLEAVRVDLSPCDSTDRGALQLEIIGMRGRCENLEWIAASQRF